MQVFVLTSNNTIKYVITDVTDLIVGGTSSYEICLVDNADRDSDFVVVPVHKFLTDYKEFK